MRGREHLPPEAEFNSPDRGAFYIDPEGLPKLLNMYRKFRFDFLARG
jgi:hypothetical protein